MHEYKQITAMVQHKEGKEEQIIVKTYSCRDMLVCATLW